MSEEAEKNEAGSEEGGFLLESLATLETVNLEDGGADGPKISVRPKISNVDAQKAIQELREKQRKLETRIAWLVASIVATILFGVVALQTNVVDKVSEISQSALNTVTGSGSGAGINCELPENRRSDACRAKRNNLDSTWDALGRQTNQFSLHGK